MPSVLIIDDDLALADLIDEVLTDEGYQVTVLNVLTPDAIRIAVGQLEPDCILLDSSGQSEYGESWLIADWLYRRDRPIPTIMFTAHLGDSQEAQQGISARSQAAHFAAILTKPFELDALLAAVAQAIGQSGPFDSSVSAE